MIAPDIDNAKYAALWLVIDPESHPQLVHDCVFIAQFLDSNRLSSVNVDAGGNLGCRNLLMEPNIPSGSGV